MRTAFLVSAVASRRDVGACQRCSPFSGRCRPGRKTLPNNWIMGQAAGIAVDAQDHVWVVQRPRSAHRRREGRVAQSAAQQVLRAGAAGAGVRPGRQAGPGLGRPGPGLRLAAERARHRASIHKGFVWIGGNGEKDGQYLKFTRDGKFVLQIGKHGRPDQQQRHDAPGQAGRRRSRPETNEVYIADGYFNHRVIVFDADTGAYKRHWGAYGKKPTDEKLEPYNPRRHRRFGNPVHCVKIAKDGLVYVCDRANNRIQVFRKDGTFVKEFAYEKRHQGLGLGLGPRLLDRRQANLPVQRRRHQQRGAHAGARHRRGRRRVRPQRPQRRRVPLGAQSRRRLQGQHLHDRGGHRKARAEIPLCRRAGGEVTSRADRGLTARRRWCGESERRRVERRRVAAR